MTFAAGASTIGSLGGNGVGRRAVDLELGDRIGVVAQRLADARRSGPPSDRSAPVRVRRPWPTLTTLVDLGEQLVRRRRVLASRRTPCSCRWRRPAAGTPTPNARRRGRRSASRRACPGTPRPGASHCAPFGRDLAVGHQAEVAARVLAPARASGRRSGSRCRTPPTTSARRPGRRERQRQAERVRRPAVSDRVKTEGGLQPGMISGHYCNPGPLREVARGQAGSAAGPIAGGRDPLRVRRCAILPGHMHPSVALLLTAVMVLANAFFVAAEFAFVKIRPTRLQQLAREGRLRARLLLGITAQLPAYLSASQLGHHAGVADARMAGRARVRRADPALAASRAAASETTRPHAGRRGRASPSSRSCTRCSASWRPRRWRSSGPSRSRCGPPCRSACSTWYRSRSPGC